MIDRFFYSADGELLIVPEQGALRLDTELDASTSSPRRSRSSLEACAFG